MCVLCGVGVVVVVDKLLLLLLLLLCCYPSAPATTTASATLLLPLLPGQKSTLLSLRDPTLLIQENSATSVSSETSHSTSRRNCNFHDELVLLDRF